MLGLETFLQTLERHWSLVQRTAPASFGSNFDATIPAGAILGGALSHSLLFTGLVALVAAFGAAKFRALWLRYLLCALAALAMVGANWGGPSDLEKELVAALFLLIAYVAGVQWIMRTNILGCFLVLAILSLVEGAAQLLGQPDSFYRLNGYAVIAALVLLLCLAAGSLAHGGCRNRCGVHTLWLR